MKSKKNKKSKINKSLKNNFSDELPNIKDCILSVKSKSLIENLDKTKNYLEKNNFREKNKRVIIPLINEVRKITKNNILKKPIFRKYTNKKYIKTKDCYCSIIFNDESYLPGILTLGHSLRRTDTKKNIVCLVQDRPSKDNKYPGLTKKNIIDILEIYDIVYGFDLLKLENFTIHNPVFKLNHYKNLHIYVNKCLILGMIDYKKIFFLDASTITLKNLDSLFNKTVNNSLRFNYFNKNKYDLACNGQYMIIKPSLELYNNLLIIIQNYKNILKKYLSRSGIDEVVFSMILFSKYSKLKNIDNIIAYQVYKPWNTYMQLSLIDDCNDLKQKSSYWFKMTKDLIDKYPKLIEYY